MDTLAQNLGGAKRADEGSVRACQPEHASQRRVASRQLSHHWEQCTQDSALRPIQRRRLSLPPLPSRSLLEVLGQVLAPQDGCRAGGRVGQVGRAGRSCQQATPSAHRSTTTPANGKAHKPALLRSLMLGSGAGPRL